jgi:glucokinase
MSRNGITVADAETLAIDIGATKVEVALVSTSGAIRRRQRIEVAEHPSDLADVICEVARELVDESQDGRTGVGCAGPMLHHGREVSPLNIPQWRGFPLEATLRKALGRNVFIDGDVRALSLAEMKFGAAKETPSFFSMVLSTGAGGAVVMNGQLLDGRTGNAGHLGHVIVVPGGRQCSCGARGCLEAEASGWAIAQMTGRPASEADQATRIRCAELFGLGVGTLASVLDVDRCYVGGSVALGFGAEFFDRANTKAKEVATMGYSHDLRIAPTGLGSDGPLLGASLLSWRSND